MKSFGQAVLALLVVAALITIFWVFLLPLFAAGKVVDRQAQIYDTETSAQTYEQSRTYQQATQLDLSRYCLQYHTSTGGAKTAVADLIRSTAATYKGPRSPSIDACINEVGE